MSDKRIRYLTLVLWPVLLALLAIPAAQMTGKAGEPNLRVDGSASAAAAERTAAQFGTDSSVAVLLSGPERDITAQGRALANALAEREIGSVITPWSDGGPGQDLRPDPESALILVMPRAAGGPMKESQLVREVVEQTVHDPVSVALTGQGVVGDALQQAGVRELRRGELLALPLLLVILLLVFRSVLAAAIPIAVGGTVLVTTTGVLSLVAEVVAIDTLAVSIASMMALALGVDYSLLIVSRFREELAKGADRWSAAATARRTAGTTVIVAGGVLLSAVGAALLVAPGPFLVSATVAVGLSAICGVICSVALVPVILGLVGERINSKVLPAPRGGDGLVVRSCRLALRRPLPIGLVVALALLAISLPALSMRAGTPGVELLTGGDKALSDYRKITDKMGPGWAAPFVVLAENPDGPVTTEKGLQQLSAFENELRGLPGAAAVLGPGELEKRLDAFGKLGGPQFASAATAAGIDIGALITDTPQFNRSGYLRLAALDGARPELRQMISSVVNIDHGGSAVRLLVVPTGAAGQDSVNQLAEELRSRADAFEATSGLRVSIGGPGQLIVDFSGEITRLVPLLLLALSLASLIVLVVLLRSLLVPLVAVILNVLTVGAAFGVLALLYNGDVGADGVPSYIAGTAVLGIMGIMFGLSIDYQVFMLSRIREAWQESGDPDVAINEGIVGTARVITGAALVMMAVFVGFALTDFPVNRQLGVGLVVAVAVDATLVRLLLLPGVLKLLGTRAWWPAPRPQVAAPAAVEPDRERVLEGQPA
ncbi:MMPL family transporter [Nocardia sp. NPDC003693]